MEIPRGRGVLVSKAKIFKARNYYESLNHPRGGDFKLKNPLWEGYGYFVGQHNICSCSVQKIYIFGGIKGGET